MDHLYLWLPWLFVAGIVGSLLYRNRGDLHPLAMVLQAVVVVGAYSLYYVVRGITRGSESEAVDSAMEIVEFQRTLQFYWEPRIQEFVLDYRWLTIFFNLVYTWWYWPVLIVVAMWLFLNKPRVYAVYRDAFLISGAVALVFFTLMPVAPPRIADPEIIDTIAEYTAAYRQYETPRFVNLYAAFPSLHQAWTLLAAIAVFIHARQPLLRAAAVASPVLLMLSIVVTGNHFIIDGIAGAVLALAALGVAHAFRSERARQSVRSWLNGR